eukprot:1333598-Amphidinium_carterae.1
MGSNLQTSLRACVPTHTFLAEVALRSCAYRNFRINAHLLKEPHIDVLAEIKPQSRRERDEMHPGISEDPQKHPKK